METQRSGWEITNSLSPFTCSALFRLIHLLVSYLSPCLHLPTSSPLLRPVRARLCARFERFQRCSAILPARRLLPTQYCHASALYNRVAAYEPIHPSRHLLRSPAIAPVRPITEAEGATLQTTEAPTKDNHPRTVRILRASDGLPQIHMTTYNPPRFPRRPKHSTVFGDLAYHCQLAYYRYEINTALYVMSPGEKLAFNVTLLSILVLLFSAVYYYLPSAVAVSMKRLAYYFTGSSSKLAVAGLTGAGEHGLDLLESSRDALASLSNSGAITSSMFAS